MKTAVMIPCYKRLRFTKYCIPLALDSAGMEAEWFLVDDGSGDGTADFLNDFIKDRKEKIHLIIHGKNRGIAKTHNEVYRLMKETDAEIFVNCDSDLLVPHNWLKDLIDAMDSSPDVGGGSAWIANDVTINATLKRINTLDCFYGQVWVPVEGCGGTLIAYRREIFDMNIECAEPRYNWGYEDAIHHAVMKQHGFKLAIYTGVQAWMVERLIWDDHEIEKLKHRHMNNHNGSMEGFEGSLAQKKGSVPW